MVLIIDGVDFSRFVAERGMQWTLSDLESPNSGRTLDGKMHRGRVCQKVKLTITCLPMNTRDISIALKTIDPEFVTVKYIDPKDGGLTTKRFYSNNKPATCIVQNEYGEEMWEGFTFPLVEE